MDRRAILIELVRHYPEAMADGGNSGEWVAGGPDSKLLLRGPLYYDAPRTWDELDRCFRILRQDARSSHLFARYWTPPGLDVRREVRFVRKSRDRLEPISLPRNAEVKIRGGAITSKLVLDCVVHQWPSWVLPAEAETQLRALSSLFRGDPFLPNTLLGKAETDKPRLRQSASVVTGLAPKA